MSLDAVEAVWNEAPFIAEVGFVLESFEAGRVESSLTVDDRHRQQHGVVHAGVIGTMADHTGGTAAMTVTPEGTTVLTVEYKINLLRTAKGDRIRCVSTVLKEGRTIVVSESEVFDGDRLVAKATITLAVLSV